MQVNNQKGHIFHTKKGLCITIPKERWINWKMQTPSSQKDFTRVAWAQLTQFDQEALMASLKVGKIGAKTIYLDFDNEAKHKKSSNTELDTVQQYYIKLVVQTSTYHYYNQYMLQELTHGNEPLHLPLTYDWKTNGCPCFIFLPYSQLLLMWNSSLNKWEYKAHSWFTLTSCSGSSHTTSDDGLPSLCNPIDEFEAEDCMAK